MKFKLKNKKNILKRLSIFLSLILFCTVLYSISNYTLKQEFKSKNVLANEKDSNNIDINSIELEATLGKLTNKQKLEALKVEMKGKTDKEITKEAIKRGIIVQQGLVLDIDKLAVLKTNAAMVGHLDEEIVKEAIKKGIVKQLGNTIITSINIEDLISLKKEMEDKTDYDIVRQAIKKGIIKGTFVDVNLEIDTNLDFTQVDLTQFGDYNKDDYVSLSDLTNKGTEELEVLYKKSLKDLNITGGQINTEYNINLKNNPIPESDADEVPQDVVVIIDYAARSDAMQLVNGMNNEVFTNGKFVNNNPKDTNFMVIPYHMSGISTLGSLENYYSSLPNNNYKDRLQVMLGKIKDDGSRSVDKNNEMDTSLKMAKDWFKGQDTKVGRTVQSSKSIIFLTGEIDDTEYNNCFHTVTDKYGSVTKKFVLDETYNATTIFITSVGYKQTLEEMSVPYASNIKKIHKNVGGIDSTFHVSYTEKAGQTSHNDVNDINTSMNNKNIAQEVADDLLNSQFNRYVNTEGKLHFNLGEDITISKEELESNENITMSKDENGDHICQLTVPVIRLKTDYEILSTNNLYVSDKFIDDLLQNIIDNTNQKEIKESEVKIFLQDRLKDLDIIITENDIKIITNNMYDAILNKKIQELDKDDVEKVKNVISADSYEEIKGITVKDILKNNNDNYPSKKYGKLTDMLMILLRDGMKHKLNIALSDVICEKYDIDVNDKNDIINGILAGTLAGDGVAKTTITKITKGTSAEVDKIIATIKTLFNSNTIVSTLNLSEESVQALKDKGLYSKKIKEVLDNYTDVSISDAKEEIIFLLRQMLNQPLKLTQTTFNVSGEGEKVDFTIEPTVKAALDENKKKLEFDYNTDSTKNNYIEYNSSLNSGSTVTKQTLINSTPILNIKRILVDKNHVVYGKLTNVVTEDNRDITAAIEVEHDGGLVFGDKSVVTFASNIINMTGTKNIKLTIDKKFQPITDATGQEPRIYRIVYNDKDDSSDDELKLIEWDITKEYKEEGVEYVVNDFPCDMYKDIIILYSVKINKLNATGLYTNSIKVSGLSGGDGNSEITVESDLPDLF